MSEEKCENCKYFHLPYSFLKNGKWVNNIPCDDYPDGQTAGDIDDDAFEETGEPAFVCRRYPKYEPKWHNDYCGEWKPRIPLEVVGENSGPELTTSPLYLLAVLYSARKSKDAALEKVTRDRLKKMGCQVQFADDSTTSSPQG